ncbi:membrane dipeptidase [Lasiosphaeris hirsuta]|uniref:Dipeptidase n=1 Tax=Lasiosphaeris hirsuta TaxID=260670 RepID=A0AA40AR42_9PEZI|nr:membrane dipeptidase [Lasiosphaeris hirsuta]
MRTQSTARASRAARISFLVILSCFLIALLFKPTRDYTGWTDIEGHILGQGKAKSIEQRVKSILKRTPLIDGHNDLAIMLRARFNNHIYDDEFSGPFKDGTLASHTDLARLRAGLNGGAFWSVFWPCPENGSDYSDANYLSSVQATVQQIDLINRLRTAYPDDFSPIVDSASALQAFKKGQLISPVGIEGLHQIGNSAATLRQFYDLGVRYATLTHNCGNKFADAALWEHPFRKAPPFWGGVSPAGRLLINEMNRIGMIVDLSHTSVDTQLDVLGGRRGGWVGSRAPVIYSHSSAYSLCPHPRNVEDRVLELVRRRNSLVMVNFAPDFVSCVASDGDTGIPDFYPTNSTLAHVASHVIYIGELIGFDHVGFGSDFDGIGSTPTGLSDVSRYPDLVAELLRRGVSDRDAAKVVGGNLLRVWKDVDAVAARLQKAGELILEDDLGSVW